MWTLKRTLRLLSPRENSSDLCDFVLVAIALVLVLLAIPILHALYNLGERQPQLDLVSEIGIRRSVSEVPIDTLADLSLNAESLNERMNAAFRLAEFKGPDACSAMRKVLPKAKDVDVKIAMIQGLGPNNRDFESVPIFLDIMAADNDEVDVRIMAATAADLHLSKVLEVYDPYASAVERRDVVDKIRRGTAWRKEGQFQPLARL